MEVAEGFQQDYCLSGISLSNSIHLVEGLELSKFKTIRIIERIQKVGTFEHFLLIFNDPHVRHLLELFYKLQFIDIFRLDADAPKKMYAICSLSPLGRSLYCSSLL